MYKHFYDELLFKYKLVHSKRLRDVYSDIPHNLDLNVWKEFEESISIINALVFKILENIKGEFKDYESYIPYFKFRDELLNIKTPILPMLWTRYDGFIRADGHGVFYSEFNYDKPCAQRECMVMGKINSSEDNVNMHYEEKLIDSIFTVLRSCFENDFKGINICFLVRATSYEENHLALLLKGIIEESGIKVIIAAPENITVLNEEVYAFDTKIKGIIRLFPGEFLKEIEQFDELIKIFDKGKFPIINDPRMVFIQNKALYAYLWNLVTKDDKRLTLNEKNVIRRTLPYTEILKEFHRKELINNKDKYVLKPALGRYSEDVYIGKLFSHNEWENILEYVYKKNEETLFIVQDFCEIKRESSVYYDGVFRSNLECYGNYGVFILQDEISGCCIRWNRGYLTSEEGTWITPILKKKSYIRKIADEGLSLELEAKLIAHGGFSGIYCREKSYIDGSNYVIEQKVYKDIVYATEKFSEIMEKTYKFALENIKGISPILSIEEYVDVILREKCLNTYLVSRLDWVIDRNRNLKLLEINSETPAGICECAFLEQMINKNKNYIGVSDELRDSIKMAAINIINSYRKYMDFTTEANVAFLSLTYYEDFTTTKAIKNILKDIDGINCIIGNIYDLEEKEDGVYLYGEKIHMIYRYYPLQWIYEEPELKWMVRHINKDVFFINSTRGIIPQSKGFLALIHELLKHKFYNKDEEDFIKKYIPYTTFDMESVESNDFVIKPLLEREGKGIRFSSNISSVPEDDVVFQERVFIEPIHDKFLVFGAYMVEGKFTGIYCREGKEITTNQCRWIPLYKEKG